MEIITCPSCRQTYNGTPGTPCPYCGHGKALPATTQQRMPAHHTPAQAPKKKKKTKRPLWTLAAVVVILLLAAGEFLIVANIYHKTAYEQCLTLWNSGDSISNNRREPDPVYHVVQPELPVDTTLERLLDEYGDYPDSIITETPEEKARRESVDSLFM